MTEASGAAGSGIVTAALLVIGDEILSGRTKDKNIGHIADHLTAIGIQIRHVLLDAKNRELRPTAELLLMFASRAQNVDESILPALSAGRTVLSDRFKSQ